MPKMLLSPACAASYFPAFNSSKFQKIWQSTLVVAIPKPKKRPGDPKSYRPISLLCVPFKLLEKLIFRDVESIIDALLPQKQAGFRHGRSTVDQVGLLTQDKKERFLACKRAGAVFVNLPTAYDKVCTAASPVNYRA